MFYPVNGDPYRSNVVLHVPFTGANNSTTFTDVSPTPKTLTRYGDTKISTTQSKWGQGAGYFDGSGDYLTCAGTDLLLGNDNFTIECYLYFSSLSVNQIVCGIYDFTTNNRSWVIQYFYTTPVLRFIDSSTGSNSETHEWTPGFSLSTWHHLAFVRNGTTLTCYVDGVSLGNKTITLTTFYNPTNLFAVGAFDVSTSPLQTLNGYLQDLRITKGVARYTADFAVPAGPLPARLPELPVRSIIQPHPFHQIARLGL